MSHWNEKYFSKNNRQDLEFDSMLKAQQEAIGACKDHEYETRCQPMYEPPSAEVMEAYRVKCQAAQNFAYPDPGGSTFCRGDAIYPKK